MIFSRLKDVTLINRYIKLIKVLFVLEKQHGDSRQPSVWYGLSDTTIQKMLLFASLVSLRTALPILVFVIMDKHVINMHWSNSFKKSLDEHDNQYIFSSMSFYLELAKYLQCQGCFTQVKLAKDQLSIIGSNELFPEMIFCMEFSAWI